MTAQEKMFKVLVSELICNKIDFSAEREKRLMTFYNHAEYYYEVFCESIHILVTNHDVTSISLDDYGFTRFGYIDNDTIIGYNLLSREDIVDASRDIIFYVELALARLQKRLNISDNVSAIKNQRSRYQMVKYS